MFAIFRKNISPQTFCRLRRILNSSAQIRSLNRLTNTPKNSVRFSAYFTSVARPYEKDNFDPKEKLEVDDTVHGKVDRALLEIDSTVRQIGRIPKRKVEYVLSIVENNGSATETHSLYLLRSCGLVRSESPVNRVELANAVWEKLQKLGCQFTGGHYNSLLKLYLECDHKFSPTEFLSRMEGSGVEPNTKTFAYLIEKYCNDGDLEGASEILQFLKDKNLPITENMFNALIKGHFKANDVEGARGILEVMQSSNLSPSAASYTVLACEYARVGDVDSVRSVLAEARAKVNFNNSHYLSIIVSFPAHLPIGLVEEFIGLLENVQGWKHDIFNSIYDLVHKEHDEAAFQLHSTVWVPGENSHTNLFLRQLIISKRPVKHVLQYCGRIKNEYADNFVFFSAAKLATEFEYFDLLFALFDEMQREGVPVRMHYFRPLLQYYNSMQSEEGVLLTLKKMSDFGIPLNSPLFAEYVFPLMSCSDPASVMSKIDKTGQSIMTAVCPLFEYYCHQGDFKNARFVTEGYSFRVTSNFDFQKFLSVNRNIRDADFLKVLSFLMKNTGMYLGDEAEAQGRLLSELLLVDRSLFQALHQSAFHQDYKYSKQALNVAWNILQRKNPSLLPLLESLEGRVSNLTLSERKEDTSNPLNIFSHHIKDKNIPMVNELEEKLLSMGVTIPPYIHAQLLNMHCLTDNLECADKLYQMLKENHPDFKINSVFIINYASILMKFSKLEIAKEVIRNECKELHFFGSKSIIEKRIKYLFKTSLEFDDIQLIECFRASLLPHSDAFESKVILHEPMVKFHLLHKDLDNAVREFKKCISEYRVTPCLDLLLRTCTATNEPAQLEEVIGAASSVLGQNVVLHKLFRALLEMKRNNQAQDVLNSLGNKADPQLLYETCLHLYSLKQVSTLEMFLSMITNIKHIDKDAFHFYLFKLYDENNNFQQALNLYDSIVKNEMFEVSEKTQKLLSNLLKRNNQAVPFSSIKQNYNLPMNATAANDKDVKEFLEAINQGNVQLSLEKVHLLKKGFIHSLPLPVVTQFLDLVTVNKCSLDLTQNDQIMGYIINNAKEVLEPLLEKYANSGDTGSLNELAGFLPDFSLKRTSFASYFAKSYIVRDRKEDLLAELEHRWDMKNKLFSLQAFDALLRDPSFEQRAIDLAEKYLQIGFNLPIAVVWAHYRINGNPEKARQIFESHPIEVMKVDSLILKNAFHQRDASLARQYIDLANAQNVKLRCRERAYKTLLDILVSKEMFHEADALVKEAKGNDIDIELHYQLALKDVKHKSELQSMKD